MSVCPSVSITNKWWYEKTDRQSDVNVTQHKKLYPAQMIVVTTSVEVSPIHDPVDFPNQNEVEAFIFCRCC